jgi:hypothetical protein
VALPGNPFAGRVPSDTKEHELRVEAEGYRKVVRKVTLSADLRVDVALESERGAAAAPRLARRDVPPRAAPPTTAAPSAPAAPPPPSSRPLGQRPIDWKDPWK